MKKQNEKSLQIQFDAVSVRHLRTQVAQRLVAAQSKSSLQDNFKHASSKKSDGQMACMFMNMMFFGALFQGLEAHFGHMMGMDNMLPDGTFAALAEVGVQLREDKYEGEAFRNKIEGYPEGRRNDPIAASRTRKAFNLVSNNDNAQFEEDTNAEIAALVEMLDLINVVEKAGQTDMKLAQGETVQSALRTAARNQSSFFSKLAA